MGTQPYWRINTLLNLLCVISGINDLEIYAICLQPIRKTRILHTERLRACLIKMPYIWSWRVMPYLLHLPAPSTCSHAMAHAIICWSSIGLLVPMLPGEWVCVDSTSTSPPRPIANVFFRLPIGTMHSEATPANVYPEYIVYPKEI